MARIIDEKKSGNNANKHATFNKNGGIEEIEKSFTIIYTVIGESNDTPTTIIDALGIPQIGNIREGLICARKTANKQNIIKIEGEEKSLWNVNCEYSNDLDSTEPTDMPPEVRWTSEEYEEVLKEDVDQPAKKVVTACGEPLLLTVKKVIPVLTIKRTENAPFNPATITTYTNTVNSQAFWGAPAKHALMAGIEAIYKLVDTLNNGKKWYVDVTYIVKFRFDANFNEPWKARILHAGTKYFPKAGAEAQTWIDIAGNTGVINLQANGQKLADNQPPVYLDFNVYKSQSWNSLNINPQSLGNYFSV